MSNKNSSVRLGQLQDQTITPGNLSPQDAQQLIHELQAAQHDLLTAQLQLENEQRKYRNLFDLSPIGLLVLDAEACILETNLTFAQMLGIERSKLIGCYLSDFVVPDGQDSYHFFFQRLLTSGQPQQCEVNLIDHGLLVVQLNGLPLSQDGKKTAYYVTVSNVTAEKQTEIDRLEQAVEGQRARILSDFINATSHDLRTPLAQIATGLYLVGKATDQELRLKKLGEIDKQVFSLAQILEQMQAMAVLDNLIELEFQPEAINRVLTDVISAAKASAEAKNIDLISNLQDDLPQIPMDTDKMFLAVLNLIHNAVQFTQPGGLISLTTYQQDDQIMIDVADNGIGIPANIIPHIFERFFKADVARSILTGGSGLGLSLAQRVVELHHGTLQVRSTPGMGTVFQISLPLNQPS